MTSKKILKVRGSSWYLQPWRSFRANYIVVCHRLANLCRVTGTIPVLRNNFPKTTLPSDNTFNSKYKLWWLRIICFANFWFLNNPDNMTTFLPGGRVFWLATYGAKQKQDQKATVQYQYVPYLYKHQASSKVLNGTGMHYLVCWLSQASETWYR